MSYFKSQLIPALSVQTGAPEDGQVAPQTVRFTPYDLKTQLGETVTIGYLKTDNAVAIRALRKDINVVSIDQGEYDKYTEVDGDKVKRARL